jgi:AcrR family transcriptional regulator
MPERWELAWANPRAGGYNYLSLPFDRKRLRARMPMSAPQHQRAEEAKPSTRMRKAERKRQLLMHAKQLFVTLGYQATTTEKIAAAAGVSEPVLHRHFANKKMLFLEVLEEVRAATLHRWHTETAHLSDPLAKFHAIAEIYLGTTREHAVEFRIIHRALVEMDDEEIASALRAFYLDCEALLAGVIAEGQQAGVFRRSLDPRIGAWELIRAALGYTLTVPLNIPLYQRDDYLPQAIDCLLHCLLKTDV